MLNIKDVLQIKFAQKTKKPNSERSYYIQQIADLTEMKFIVIFGKVNHLTGVRGTVALRNMYEDSLRHSEDLKWKRIHFWKLLKQSKDLKT